jgi:hypothetical protein
MARKHQILFDDDELEAAQSWHSGGSSMLYAISSTGKLSLGTQRPHNDEEDRPMTDDEWFAYIASNLEGEAEEAIDMAKEQMKGASRQEKDELRENIAAFQSIIRKTKKIQSSGLSGPRKEEDIVYENATHWVSREPNGDMYIWRTGLTHSTRCGVVGHGVANQRARAIAEADRRNK